LARAHRGNGNGGAWLVSTKIVALVKKLEEEAEDVTGEIAERLSRSMPSLQEMPPELRSALQDYSRQAYLSLLGHLKRGEVPPDPLDIKDLKRLDLSEILRALQVGSEIVWRRIREIWAREGGTTEETIYAAEVLWNFYFQASNMVTRHYTAQQEEMIRGFNDLLNRIRSTSDRDQLISTALEGVCRDLGFRRAVLFALEGENLVPLGAHAEGKEGWARRLVEERRPVPLPPLAEIPEARAVHEGRMVVFRAGDRRSVAFIVPRPGSFVALLPLRIGGSVRGLVYLETDDAWTVIGRRNQELLSSYADTVSMAWENTNLYRELMAKRRAMDQLLSRVNTAHEEERARIARELHDSVAQSLLKIIYTAGFALDFLKEDPSLAVDEIEEVQQRAKECLQELRAIMANLRPVSLDILGLKDSIIRYAEQYEEEYAITVELDLQGLEDLTPSVELAIFRILQEQLANVRKHSNADWVKVQTSLENGDLVLTVQDNGVGFDPSEVGRAQEGGKHLGIMAMRERAELLGGELFIDSAPGKGTRITVRIPMISRKGS